MSTITSQYLPKPMQGLTDAVLGLANRVAANETLKTKQDYLDSSATWAIASIACKAFAILAAATAVSTAVGGVASIITATAPFWGTITFISALFWTQFAFASWDLGDFALRTSIQRKNESKDVVEHLVDLANAANDGINSLKRTILGK